MQILLLSLSVTCVDQSLTKRLRNISLYYSKFAQIHLLPYQKQLRLPEAAEGALPFHDTVMLLGAAEGNGTPYKLQTFFSHYHRQQGLASRNEL